MLDRRRRHRPSACLPFLLAVVMAVPAAAQVPEDWRQPTTDHSSKVSVPDGLGRDALEVARRAVESKDVDGALAAWQDLLDRYTDQVTLEFEVKRENKDAYADKVLPGDRYEGLRSRVMELIRALPADGRDRYVAREGPAAAATMARAIANRDEAALRSVVLTRFLTPSGPLAHIALIDMAFEDGRYAEAAVAAARLRATAALTADPPAVRARAAAREALARAALRDRAGLLALRDAVAADRDVALTFMDGARSLGSLLDDALARTPAPAVAPTTDPGMGVFSLRAWEPVRIPVQDLGEQDNRESFFRGRSQSWRLMAFSPVVPVVTDTAIFVTNGVRLEALSLFTGKPLWPAVEGRRRSFAGRRNRALRPEPVIDRELVFACLEDEPQMEGESSDITMGYRPVETIAARKLWAVDTRTGTVRWTHSRGDSTRKGDERAFLDRITVNTPPLVIGERLYAAASYYRGSFHSWICCFDRNTGAVIWRTYIAQGQSELNMFGNPLRECVPGLVGEHDGVLFVSTNLGVVAAVDAMTGTTLWTSAYTQEPIPSNDSPNQVRERPPGWAGQRPLFFGHHVFIAPSDCMQVLAFDTTTGVARPVEDTKRARLTHRNADPENPLRFVLGLFDGLLVVSGRQTLAFDVRPMEGGGDAEFRWTTTGDGSTLTRFVDGQPAVLGNRIFVLDAVDPNGPGRGNARIVELDLTTGKRLDDRTWSAGTRSPVLGNLVMTADAAVVFSSANPEASAELSAYLDMEALRQRLTTEVAQNPDDPARHFRIGQLLLQMKDRWPEAVRELEAAVTTARRAGGASEAIAGAAASTLHTVFLVLATEPAIRAEGLPDAPEERFARALAYAASTRQRVDVLLQQLSWARHFSTPEAVSTVAARMLKDVADETAVLTTGFTEYIPELRPGTTVRVGVLAAFVAAEALTQAGNHAEAIHDWDMALQRFGTESFGDEPSVWHAASARIAATIREHGAACYAAEEAAAAALFASGRETGDPATLRAVIERFPNASVIGAARAELVQRLVAGGRHGEVVKYTARELARTGTATPGLLVDLSRALTAGGLTESGREIAAMAGAAFPNENVTVDGATLPAKAWAAARAATASAPVRETPRAPLGAKVVWTETSPPPSPDIELIIPGGTRPPAGDALVLFLRDGNVEAHALTDGALRWKKPATGPVAGTPLNPIWHDDRLIAVFDGEVVAIDPATGSEFWRTPLAGGRAIALAVAHGKAYALVHEVTAARRFVVVALDLMSGDRLHETALPNTERLRDDNSQLWSFETSPQWLLVRFGLEGSGSVISTLIDGATGALVPGRINFLTAGGRPTLSPNDLLVQTVPGDVIRGSAHGLKLVGENPRTHVASWVFALPTAELMAIVGSTPDELLLSVRGLTPAGTRNVQPKRELVALDIVNGRTLMTAELKQNETLLAARRAGDLTLMMMRTTTSYALFVRAVDAKTGATAWESVQIPARGGRAQLSAFPGRDYIVIRQSTPKTASTRSDSFQLLDRHTGVAKDVWPLENTTAQPQRVDVELRDGVLVVLSGPEISVRR